MTNNTFFIDCNSWGDFQIKLNSLNKKEKGDAFELLTKLYFKINPVFSFYDEVWMLSEVPQKTLEYLKIPSLDLGIDLIAKNGDEYHAIQCKFHSEIDSSVSFKEVATFISLLEGNKNFTQGYICSSANITSRNFEKIETKPITTILADTWQSLDKDFFDKARHFLNKEKFDPIAYKPKEHQKKALKQALNYFIKENNSRGKLIFPCGAGKSLTGYWITQELKSKATIIAVPSLSLVKQTLDVYLREIVAKGKKVKWLCICSDEGIGSEEDIVFKTENLGVPCQTDPIYIKNWLLENKDENIIIFTTYQSGRIIAEISKNLNFIFNVGIFDEAHKTVGSDKKLFSHLLFDENISIDKRIFMTATERFYAGSKGDIISMDDEDIYGDTFAQMSFKEAIEMELLTDYKVITIDVKKSEIAEFIKDNNLVQLNDKWKKETEARSLASMLALRKAMKIFPIKNAVSFHSSIDKAVRNKELQSYITETYNYTPIDTFTVSGKMPTTKRNIIVKEFADSAQSLITNARCLTEGVDVPNIDCIVFADPRKSKVDIVQALGRALRKKEGKDWGYVILPVVYDDINQEIDNENFNEILAIVRGLASNDDRIIEYFKDKKDVGSSSKKEKIDQFQFEVFSDYIDANQLSEQLQIKLWDKLSQFNWMPFEEAKEFITGLQIKSSSEFTKLWRQGKLPNNIPSKPRNAYKNEGFISMPNFLGYDTKFQDWMSFEEAREHVRKLGLTSTAKWFEYSKTKNKPVDIPSDPKTVYRNDGWENWGDWLGTYSIAKKEIEFVSYEDAKKYARNLNLKTVEEWYSLKLKRPNNIPSAPQKTYENKGWQGWGDFLGLKNYRGNNIEWLPFDIAREKIRKVGLKTVNDWYEYARSEDLDIRIPRAPEVAYKTDGWKGIGDWIGTDKIADQFKEYLSFEEAKMFMKVNGIKSEKEWISFRNINSIDNIPYKLERTYSKQWKGAKDFFDSQIFTYDEAKEFIKKFNLKSSREYFIFTLTDKSIINLPGVPYRVYKNKGWKDWADFLGYEKRKTSKRNYISFDKAKDFIKNRNINSSKEYKEYLINNPIMLTDYLFTSKPERVYKDYGWKGWEDFLGKEK
jgi:superfamily II DNA or RNA helicase